jgi:hypothetical protein
VSTVLAALVAALAYLIVVVAFAVMLPLAMLVTTVGEVLGVAHVEQTVTERRVTWLGFTVVYRTAEAGRG